MGTEVLRAGFACPDSREKAQMLTATAKSGRKQMSDSVFRRWLMRRRFRHLRPVVIGGCGRSGTSLLLSILSSHPGVTAIPHETQLLCPGAYWPSDGRVSPPDVGGLFRELSQLPVSAVSVAWCEKTPRNVQNFGAIIDVFGGSARLIHIVRDGRDVVLSRHPRSPEEFWVSPERWTADVRAGLQFQSHPQVLTLHYEDLVTDLRNSCQTLCRFLHLEYDDRLERYPQFARMVESDAWFGSARPVDVSSIGSWKRRENATRVQQLLDCPDALPLLKELGYAD